MIADLTKTFNELCENNVEEGDPRFLKACEAMQKDILDNYISLIDPISDMLGELYIAACLFEDEDWYKNAVSNAVDDFVSRAKTSIQISTMLNF